MNLNLILETAEKHLEDGLISGSESDFNKSVAAYEEAIKIDSKNPIIHYELSFVYSRLGQQDRANEIFEVADAIRI